MAEGCNGRPPETPFQTLKMCFLQLSKCSEGPAHLHDSLVSERGGVGVYKIAHQWQNALLCEACKSYVLFIRTMWQVLVMPPNTT